MKYKFPLIGFVFLSASFGASAKTDILGAYENFLWVPAVPASSSNSSPLIITDTGVSTVSVTFPKISHWRAISSSCYGQWEGMKQGNYRYWLQYKEGWHESNGLRYRISSSRGWEAALSTPVPGIITLVSPNKYKEQEMSFCWVVGEDPEFTPSDDIPAPLFFAEIEVDRRNAIPGVYNIKFPYWWAYEENKGSGFEGTIAWKGFGFAMQRELPSYIDIPVTVVSKCHFNTSPINLSHGTMTGRNADGNPTSPYNLNVTCTPGTSLSVKLLGTQKVSGKTDNYTQCGIGGMCELTFDNGKYDETMRIDNSKMLSIKSTYRLNDISKPVAESFEGSGVLQVLVN
ncbi:spore coat protein U domain-containing protein [Escherichia coli]|uniref:spore coat protein U domain-containing protein n=1 Tax=Escherichia coli TaxID=562 RepID=UPI00105EE92B|nr:spore coat protein U domain-containing protein [Escherichia coli]VEW03684.1 conserved exported hypothetical protein [Escherichia coli]